MARVVKRFSDDDGGVDRGAADEAADYCRGVLTSIERFDEALQHLSMAMGRNIAVAENVWEPTGGES